VPDLFQTSIKALPIKLTGCGNSRAFQAAVKPFLKLSPDIFSGPDFVPAVAATVPTKFPIKKRSRAKDSIAKAPTEQQSPAKRRKVVVQSVAERVEGPQFSRAGRLLRQKKWYSA
jgi:hypothetical protein